MRRMRTRYLTRAPTSDGNLATKSLKNDNNFKRIALSSTTTTSTQIEPRKASSRLPSKSGSESELTNACWRTCNAVSCSTEHFTNGDRPPTLTRTREPLEPVENTSRVCNIVAWVIVELPSQQSGHSFLSHTLPPPTHYYTVRRGKGMDKHTIVEVSRLTTALSQPTSRFPPHQIPPSQTHEQRSPPTQPDS